MILAVAMWPCSGGAKSRRPIVRRASRSSRRLAAARGASSQRHPLHPLIGARPLSLFRFQAARSGAFDLWPVVLEQMIQPTAPGLSRPHTASVAACSTIAEPRRGRGFLFPLGYDIPFQERKQALGNPKVCVNALNRMSLTVLRAIGRLDRAVALKADGRRRISESPDRSVQTLPRESSCHSASMWRM